MAFGRQHFRQLLTAIGLIAFISSPALADEKKSCDVLMGFGAPSLQMKDVEHRTDLPVVRKKLTAVEVSSDRFLNRESAEAAIAKLTRADLEDQAKFTENLKSLARRLGLKPAKVRELSELLRATGLLGGDLHFKAYLLSYELGHFTSKYDEEGREETLETITAGNFKIDKVHSRKTIDQMNQDVLTPHTEDQWAIDSTVISKKMTELAAAMIEASYPRTASLDKKLKFFKKNLNVKANAEQVLYMDQLIKNMTTWQSEVLLQYFYKATLQNIAQKAHDESDPMYVRALNRLSVAATTPLMATGLLEVATHSIGFAAFIGAVTSVFSITVAGSEADYGYSYLSGPLGRPITYIHRKAKSLLPWIDAKFQEMEIERIILGAGPRSKLFSKLANKAKVDPKLLLSPTAQGKSTYDIGVEFRRQSLGLQAITQIMPDTDENDPKLYPNDNETLLKMDPRMAAADYKVARNNTTVAVEFAEDALNRQLARLADMKRKNAEFKDVDLTSTTRSKEITKGEDGKPLAENLYSTMQKKQMLTEQIGEQNADIRYSLMVLRIQIRILQMHIQKMTDYMHQHGTSEDLMLMRKEFEGLEASATDLYVAKTEEFGELIK